MTNAYRNAIRKRIMQLTAQQNASMCIIWDIQEEERLDPTLLSMRAYGTRQHSDVVIVACDVSGIWEKLPKKRILMPLLQEVLSLRKEYLGNDHV